MDYKKFHSQYLEEGCLKIENFLTLAEVEELRKGVSEAVKDMPEENSPVFSVYGAGKTLHWWNPIFKKHTFSQKIKDLLRNFQYKDPVIVQSMIIFKKPKIGEIVRPHQDSTFLYTEPPTCIGLWFPLEDVTLENGCLWFVPGSHKGEIHQRFVRNPTEDPLLIMKGKVPEYADDEYVAVPAKKGDCVLIHGSVIHKSGRNTTKVARTVYTYH